MMKVLIDSREQEPLPINPGMYIDEVERVKLDVGDYGCEIGGIRLPIYFERKSIGDLWGTLTSDMARWKKEVQRAQDAKVMLYLAIEGTLEDVYRGYEHSQIFGSQIVKTIFMFKVKYGIEPVFCANRASMKYYICETFDAVRRNMAKESDAIAGA